jgi:DNA-directed RNA polymerase subunit RPC12/RpoP
MASARDTAFVTAAKAPPPFSFCCPACGTKLESDTDGYACPGCTARFALRDEVPSFTDIGYFYGTLPRESVTEPIELACRDRMGELRRTLAARKVKGRRCFYAPSMFSHAGPRVWPLAQG